MFSSHQPSVRATSQEKSCRSSAATPADDRSRFGLLSAIALITLLVPPALKSAPRTPATDAGTGAAHVEQLLAAMTLDEKIAFIHGATEPASSYQGQAGYL